MKHTRAVSHLCSALLAAGCQTQSSGSGGSSTIRNKNETACRRWLDHLAEICGGEQTSEAEAAAEDFCGRLALAPCDFSAMYDCFVENTASCEDLPRDELLVFLLLPSNLVEECQVPDCPLVDSGPCGDCEDCQEPCTTDADCCDGQIQCEDSVCGGRIEGGPQPGAPQTG
jgi:hypothetical protein